MCLCSPVSIAVTKTDKGILRECRHCGERILDVTTKVSCFLDEFPEYKAPRIKGKHLKNTTFIPPTDKNEG